MKPNLFSGTVPLSYVLFGGTVLPSYRSRVDNCVCYNLALLMANNTDLLFISFEVLENYSINTLLLTLFNNARYNCLIFISLILTSFYILLLVIKFESWPSSVNELLSLRLLLQKQLSAGYLWLACASCWEAYTKSSYLCRLIASCWNNRFIREF